MRRKNRKIMVTFKEKMKRQRKERQRESNMKETNKRKGRK